MLRIQLEAAELTEVANSGWASMSITVTHSAWKVEI